MPRWLIMILVVILLVPLAIPASVSAQTPIDTVLSRVKSYMESQIGRSFIIVQYTYALNTWDNEALGCPTPGVTNEPQETRGYNWTITIDGDATFEVHSDLSGDLIVICTPINRLDLISYDNYQSAEYVIDYPQSWQPVSDPLGGFEVGFFPDGVRSCENPGMIIQRIEGLVSAESMLNDALLEAGFVQNVGLNTPIAGGSGLTTTYQAQCGSVALEYRAAVYPDDTLQGGYTIQQWSKVNDYLSWEPVFLQLLGSFKKIDDILANATPGAETTDGTPPPVTNGELDPIQLLGGYLLAHSFVNDLYVSAMDDLPGIRITRNEGARRSYEFSPDGRMIIYIEPDSRSDERLELVLFGERAVPLTSAIVPYFPATWSPTSTVVAYIAPAADEGQYDIHTIQTSGDGDAVLGSFAYPADCEADTSAYVNTNLYWAETGVEGNTYRFDWLPDNRFLLTTDCAGMGLGIWSDTDGLTPLTGPDGEILYRAALSQDKTQVATLTEDGVLVIIDLNTLELTPIELDVQPDQLAWNDDGTQLYFSVLDEIDTAVMDDEDFEDSAIRRLGIFPYESTLNTVSINMLNLDSNEVFTLWEDAGYAVGRMQAAPNGAGLIFSFIPSDRDYLDGFRHNLVYNELRFLLPETRVLWLPPTGGQAELLLVAQQPILSSVTGTVQ